LWGQDFGIFSALRAVDSNFLKLAAGGPSLRDKDAGDQALYRNFRDSNLPDGLA